MKVKIEMTVAVDPEEWRDAYGTADSDADVRDEVRRWAWNALRYHPDGLIEVSGAE